MKIQYKKKKTKRIKRTKRTKTKRKNPNNCKYVPCGASINKCRPSYCYPESSRNWTFCNMSNWSKDKHNFSQKTRIKYAKLKRYCKPQKYITKQKRVSQPKYTVDAITLHNKMPYIWRHLRPETRKQMIRLANMPKKNINIQGHIFSPSGEKNNPQYATLRKKYKNI